jgi:hypothetical protein
VQSGRLTVLRTFMTSVAAAATTAGVMACPKNVPVGLTGLDATQDVVVNGLPLLLTQVQGTDPAVDVLDRTEKAWKAAGYAVKRNSIPGWEVLAALSEECLVTLQLAPRRSAAGYLAVRRKERREAASLATFGLTPPGDTKVGSEVASNDQGRRGVTVSMTSAHSLDELSTYFIQQLKDQKWSGIRPHRVIDKRAQKVSQLISAQRGRQQLQMVMWTDLETHVVLTVGEGL